MDVFYQVFSVYGENPGLYLSLISLLGLLVGSFLNVVIYRLPIMMENQLQAALAEAEGKKTRQDSPFNLMVPASACPKCHHKITAIENIPVLSYLFQKGKCTGCSTRISMRYPLVELCTGLLFFAVAWQFGWSLETLFGLLFTTLLISMSGIDFDHKLLPDELTLPLLWSGLLASLFTDFTTPREAILGAAFGYGSLWIIYKAHRALTGREGMGYGDFKLFAALGAWLGWLSLPLVAMLAAVVGLFWGISSFALKKQSMTTTLPFGPCLAFGGWICMLWGRDINQILQALLFT